MIVVLCLAAAAMAFPGDLGGYGHSGFAAAGLLHGGGGGLEHAEPSVRWQYKFKFLRRHNEWIILSNLKLWYKILNPIL